MTHDITKSVRFFPNWRPEATEQVIGFLQMTNELIANLGRIDRWVEVGSYFGESATMLLGFKQIDRIELVERSPVHADILRKKFGDRCLITEASSLAAAATMPPASVYVVYIDADHSYEAVKADIQAWLPAVRRGGYIAGHDHHAGFPGVQAAVAELLGAPDKLFIDSSWIKEVE